MERDELIATFTKSEVETAEELLRCIDGPVTADKFRRMLLLFLKGHYSNASNYSGFEHLDCFVWHPDKDESKLTIDFTHIDSDEYPDDYPGIFLSFGGLQYDQIAIGGNFAGNSDDRAGTHNSKESVVRFEMFHVFKKASDAYDAAEMTSRVLTAMAGPLASHGGATGFQILGVRVPKKKKPSPRKHYAVATGVEIRYTLAVTRTLESHRIRMITQALAAKA